MPITGLGAHTQILATTGLMETGVEGSYRMNVGTPEVGQLGQPAGHRQEPQVPEMGAVPVMVVAVTLRVRCDQADRRVPVASLLGGLGRLTPIERSQPAGVLVGD
ncbi:MAG TPA: hypothetical protein VN408_08565 [Actinoplanes sp.]|nr:hypothetical protein [Actinoplanes sp.]